MERNKYNKRKLFWLKMTQDNNVDICLEDKSTCLEPTVSLMQSTCEGTEAIAVDATQKSCDPPVCPDVKGTWEYINQNNKQTNLNATINYLKAAHKSRSSVHKNDTFKTVCSASQSQNNKRTNLNATINYIIAAHKSRSSVHRNDTFKNVCSASQSQNNKRTNLRDTINAIKAAHNSRSIVNKSDTFKNKCSERQKQNNTRTNLQTFKNVCERHVSTDEDVFVDMKQEIDTVPLSPPIVKRRRHSMNIEPVSLCVFVNHDGFLNTLKFPGGDGSWKLAWFKLSGHILEYWNCPGDEDEKDPLGSIDLRKCVPTRIGQVDRALCVRAFTFLIEPNFTTARYFLSASTKDEFQEWCEKLTYVLARLSIACSVTRSVTDNYEQM